MSGKKDGQHTMRNMTGEEPWNSSKNVNARPFLETH